MWTLGILSITCFQAMGVDTKGKRWAEGTHRKEESFLCCHVYQSPQVIESEREGRPLESGLLKV